MHSAPAVASLALLGLASAAPAPKPNGNQLSGMVGTVQSFVVNNVPTGNNVTRNGYADYNAALSRYGFSVDTPSSAPATTPATGAKNAIANTLNGVLGGTPSSASSGTPSANKVATGQKAASTLGTGGSAPQSEQGEVSATSQMNDVEYTSQIQVGGQTIEVNFDTGSSDLWLFNTGMSAQLTQGHTLYNPSNSKTFKKIPGATFAASYGDSSKVSGSVVGTDIVNIGGADFENQVIELPDTASQSFVSDTKSNGLVGLAFGKLNTVKPTQAMTFIENVAPQLKQPVFTANLKHVATGSYEFGNIDTTSFTGQMAWTPVDSSKGFWSFSSTTYAIGNNPTANRKTNPTANPAIADTGTSLLLMDPTVVQDYYSQVQGAKVDQTKGGYTFPCNAQLPDLYIGLNGNDNAMNQIPGSLINYANIDGTNCFGGLQSNQGGNLQIMGGPLFKSAFIAFDFGNKRLGFASHSTN